MSLWLRNFIVNALKSFKPSTRIAIATRLTRWSVRLAFLAHEIEPEIKASDG